MANRRLDQKPSFFPDLPEPLVGKSQWAGRSFKAHQSDTGAKTDGYYITTGVYPDASTTQKGAELHKAMTVIFDLDLIDLYDNDEFLAAGIEALLAGGSEVVYSTSVTKPQVFDLQSFSTSPLTNADAEKDRLSSRKHVIKAYLISLPQESLMALCNEVAPAFIDILEEYLGKPQQITYSGTGVHVHYALADTEGWTSRGLDLVDPADRDALEVNIPEWKRYYKLLNNKIVKDRMNGVQFDDKCSDIGTCVTREVGSVNTKHSTNTKTVTPIFQDRIDPDARLTLAGCKEIEIEQPKSKTKSKAAAMLKDAKGRSHDSRVKRFPKRLSGAETVTFEFNGQEITSSVTDLMRDWKDICDQGVAQPDGATHKLKVRLDWVSNGSINAWCRFNADPDGGDRNSIIFLCDVDKYLNANERHVHEVNGKLVGMWVYEGGVYSQLLVTDKGAVRRVGQNYVTILTLDPRVAGKIRENVRTRTIEVHSSINIEANSGNPHVGSWASQMEWMPLTDRHIQYFRTYVIEQYFGVAISKESVFEAIDTVASANGYDPVTAWIESITWDGVRRLDGTGAWLPRVMHMDPSHDQFDYYSFIGRNVMLGITRNIFTVPKEPTLCQHMMLITGPQNAGKSTFAATIAGVDYVGRDYYGDSDIDLTKQADLMITMRGKSVMEIPELAAFNKRDFDTIKSFVTRARMEAREPYARTTTKENKATYFIGTTNAFIPLGDPTGNRRFLVVDFYKDMDRSQRWDLNYLRQIIPQLYAEAYQRVVVGQHIPAERQQFMKRYCGTMVEDWNLSIDEIIIQDQKNSGYTAVEQTSEAISAYLNNLLSIGKHHTTYEQLRKELKDSHYIDRVPANRILAEVLGREGWESCRLSGRRMWRYTGDAIAPSLDAKATLSGHNSALDVPTEETPMDNTPPANANADMLAMMKQMQETLAALQAENKELRSRLDAQNEPRRVAPAKRDPAPAPAKKAQAEAPESSDINSIEDALTYIKAHGIDVPQVALYLSLDPSDRRVKMLAPVMIEIAQEHHAENM